METLATDAPHHPEAVRPRRTRLILGITALVVAGMALGTWAVIESNQSDDLAVATEFADTWVAAWLTNDGEAAAALFAESGVLDMSPHVAPMEGRPNIAAIVGWGGPMVEYRRGEVTKVDDGVFAFTVESFGRGQTRAGEVTITLEGDLVSHARLEGWDLVD